MVRIQPTTCCNHNVTWCSGLFPVSTDKTFFVFNNEFNDMLGLEPDASPLRIFLRDENKIISECLHALMRSQNLLFYLEGPPGVGKTKESLIWMLQSLNENQNTDALWAWIPLIKGGGAETIYLVYLLNPSTTKNTVAYRCIQTKNLIPTLQDLKVGLIVFDNCNKDNVGLGRKCAQLGMKVIVVTSMQIKPDDSFARQMCYTTNGWKEEEYNTACEDDDFYESVKDNLKTGDFSDEEMNDRAMRGGGSQISPCW